MQGDVQAVEDSHDNMYRGATQGTEAAKIRFALGSTRFGCKPDDRTGRFVTSPPWWVAMG
jgi:hypothetical protein